MFKKDSTHTSRINNKLRRINNIKILKDPNFTKITIFTLSICLILYLMLPFKIQLLINKIIQQPIILSLLIVFCLLIGYINISVSISLIVFLSVLYFNQLNNNSSSSIDSSRDSNDNYNNDISSSNDDSNIYNEGFKSSMSVDVKNKEDDVVNKIKDLFAGGPMVKSFNENHKALRDIKEKEKAD